MRLLVSVMLAVAIPLVSSNRLIAPGQNLNKQASSAAATENVRLSNELTWLFGNKQQHGWYLYTPLIKELIKTNQEPVSPKFADSVAAWQRKASLSPTGIIDSNT